MGFHALGVELWANYVRSLFVFLSENLKTVFSKFPTAENFSFFARSRFPSFFQYFSKNELFKHVLRPGTYLGTRVLTRRVRWCAVRPQKRLGRPVEHRVFGTISISTWNWGKHEIYNSQYLACLPLFNPYIYTVSSLWIIKPTKVHLSTIYPISQLPFSPRKIVNLWRYRKSLKNMFWLETKS